MILDRLVLHNFKRFRDAEIEFKDGITGILGNNGTGKSSLVTAVFFALYGVQATGIAPDYIVSSFAGQREKCEVRLDFRIGGDSYTVVRTFRKGKTVSHDATFHRDGKLMATGVSPVEEAVKRTLGMGPTDFRNTIYAAQKDLLTLLENTPGKRREWFQKALGIDYLKNGSDAVLKKEIDEKTGELQRREGELAAMAGRQGEVELETLRASVQKFKEAIAEHGKLRDAKKKERAVLDEQQKVLAGKQLAYNRLLEQQQNILRERDADEQAAKKIEAQIALIREEEAEYERLRPLAGSYEQVQQKLEKLQKKKEEFVRLGQELGFATREVDDLAARAEKQRGLIRALDADAQTRADLVTRVRAGLGAGDIAEDRLETAVHYRLAEISRLSGSLAAQLERYREEREKTAAGQETIRNAGAEGVCPLCRQKLGEHFGSIDREFSTRLQELEKKAVAGLERQENLGKEKAAIEALKPVVDTLRALNEKLRQKPAYEEELALLEAKKRKKEDEEHAIRNALAGLGYRDEEFRECEKESAEIRRVQLRFIDLGKKIGQGLMAKQHLEAIRRKIAGRTKDLGRLDGEIRAAAFDPKEAARLDAKIAGTDEALRGEEVAVTGATRDLRFTEEKIAEYNRTEAQIAALRAQAAGLGEEIEHLRLTRGIIADYVIWLMQVVRSRLEGEVSRIISEITGGRYEQVLLDEDFNLLVRDIDNDFPIDRFSGGEQDDIAVALRIALSRYLAELHDVHESTVLIFDEIFGSQDEERRSSLLTALRTQESRFPQILLISHIGEMQGEFANTLMIEMATDGSSRVKEVSD